MSSDEMHMGERGVGSGSLWQAVQAVSCGYCSCTAGCTPSLNGKGRFYLACWLSFWCSAALLWHKRSFVTKLVLSCLACYWPAAGRARAAAVAHARPRMRLWTSTCMCAAAGAGRRHHEGHRGGAGPSGTRVPISVYRARPRGLSRAGATGGVGVMRPFVG